jgi:hypothetical protein
LASPTDRRSDDHHETAIGRIRGNLDSIGAKRVFLVGCGQCATVAHTGGEKEILVAKARLEQEGFEVTGWAIGDVACHLGGMRLDARKHAGDIKAADALLALTCGAGVQTVADAVSSRSSRAGERVSRHGRSPRRVRAVPGLRDCVL